MIMLFIIIDKIEKTNKALLTYLFGGMYEEA